jgi:hypothetical protein
VSVLVGPDKEQKLSETNFENGLETIEAKRRLERYGYNEILRRK